MAVAIVVVVDVVVVSWLHSSIWRFNMRYFFSPATPDPALPQPHQTSSCLWSPSQDERRRERGRAAERCVLFVCLLVRSVMCAAHKPLKPQRQQRHPVFPAVCLPLCRRRSLYPPTTLDVACRCRLVPQPFVAFWTSHPHPHSDTP